MASTDSDTMMGSSEPTLTEQAQTLLDAYNPTNLHSQKLRSEFLARDASSGEGSNEHNSKPESDLFVDPANVQDLENEVIAFKEYFDQVKFSWQESNVKRRFLQRILSDDLVPVTESDIDSMDKSATEKKTQLKEYKQFAENIREQISNNAQTLDQRIAQSNNSTEELRSLAREVRHLENELSIMRSANATLTTNNKDLLPPMTVAEAEQVLDDQIGQLHTMTDSISKTRESITSTKTNLSQAKRNLDKLHSERTLAERAKADAEKSKIKSDSRIEKACRSFQTSQVLMEHLLGLKNVERTLNPLNGNTQLLLNYEFDDKHENVRTTQLCLEFTKNENLLESAWLVDSDESIQDIFKEHQHSGDLTSLVQEVLTRVSH